MVDGETLVKVVAPVLVATATTLRILYRRYLKETTSERSGFLHYLVSGLYFYLARFFQHRTAAAFSLRRYARAELAGVSRELIVPAKYPVHLPLDDAYVPLVMKVAANTTMAHRDLLKVKGGRYLIVGDPGSGKSSLAKKIFRSACQDAVNRPTTSRLPFMIELRRLPRAAEEDEPLELSQHLRTLMTARSDIYRPDILHDTALTGRGLVLILDGLDEIPTDQTEAVVEAIEELSRILHAGSSDSLVVVTTRVQHYERLAATHALEEFQALELQRFSISDMFLFLSRWPFKVNQVEGSLSLFNKIQSSPALLELCSNPLILAMFVARHEQTEGESMVDTRTGFYGEIVDEFIINRRIRSANRAGRDQLRRERLRILGWACLEHLLSVDEDANSMTRRVLAQAIDVVKPGLPDEEVEGLIEELAIDTGLFSEERSGDTYRFMHLTFLEYLAAKEIVEGGESGWVATETRVLDFSRGDRVDQRFYECLSFSGGLAPRALVSSILGLVLDYSSGSLAVRVAMESGMLLDGRVLEACRASILRLERPGDDFQMPVVLSELRIVLSYLRLVSALGAPGGHHALPTAGGLVASLANQGPWADSGMFSQLCKLEPSVCFEAAERTRSGELLGTAALCCDDLAVLAPLVDRLAPPDGEVWLNPLIGAALRNRGVAKALLGARPNSNAILGSVGWCSAPVLGGSLYGDLLERLSHHAGSSSFPLRLARTRPPRRSNVRTALFRSYLVTCLPPSVALIPLAVTASFRQYVIIGGGLIVLWLAGLSLVFVVRARHRAQPSYAGVLKVGSLRVEVKAGSTYSPVDFSLIRIPTAGSAAGVRMLNTYLYTNRLRFSAMLLNLREPDANAIRWGTGSSVFASLWRWTTGVSRDDWVLLKELSARRTSEVGLAFELSGP